MPIREDVFEGMLRSVGIDEEAVRSLRQTAARLGTGLEAAVLDQKILSPEILRKVLGKHLHAEYLAIDEDFDPSVLQHLPETLIKRYQILPVSLKGRSLRLGMVNPVDITAIDYVRTLTDLDIDPVGILESDFFRLMDKHFSYKGVQSLLQDISIPEVSAAAADAVSAESGPVARLVNTLLTHAVKMRASDIHIEPQEKVLIVRFRIDGLLKTIETLPKQIMPNVLGRIKVISGMDIGEKRLPQDGRIDLRLLDHSVDLRVSSLPGKYGEKLVLRVLDKSSFLLGLDQLGLEPETQVCLEEITGAGTGMLLVTGPTGSGKSTTLYALLDRVRSPTLNILTLEDPVEYELLSGKSREAGITQVQINPRIGLDFAAGLRACLRQDPDILMVGEIRDLETAEIAFTTALTGHFVLSSLHTNDAPSTVARLMDMKVEPFLITASLRGVIAQRLVRRLCSACKESYRPPRKLLERMSAQLTKVPESPSFFRPRGCPDCAGSGYRGRIGLYEFLAMSEELSHLVAERAAVSRLRAAASSAGMKSLRQAGLEATFNGLTTMAEVLRVTPGE